MTKSVDNLIWIDLEMTGLDPMQDRIIEIATIVTDAHLNILAEGPVIAIKQTNIVLEGMDAWNTKQHGQSGLTERVKNSLETEASAEAKTLQFLAQYIESGVSPMCGNSICQDRRFLNRYMPQLEAYFHYRHIDVRTLKELARRWKPEIMSEFKKVSKHLALDDIKDSIEELAFYRSTFLQI